jgi:hypothetical protein
MSYRFISVMATRHFCATQFTLILPFIVTRIGLMIANWVFTDKEDPNSNVRTSLTLIDVSVRLTRSLFLTFPNIRSSSGQPLWL